MTAMLSSLLDVLPARPLDRPNRPALEDESDATGFAALFQAVVPAPPGPETPAPAPTPDPLARELKPRARLGIWPTQPARFSPPKRNDATTSSAPAGPEDGPSNGPLKADNTPRGPMHGKAWNTQGIPFEMLDAVETELDAPAPEGFDAAFDAPRLDPLQQGSLATPFRRRPQGRPTMTTAFDAWLGDAAPTAESEIPEMSAMADGQLDADVSEDPLGQWEDVLLEQIDDAHVRVEFDADLAIEVQARHGEVDVHLEGTREALDTFDGLGELEVDLEQSLADGSEHHLGQFTWAHRESVEPQGEAGVADPKDATATDEPRPLLGGRLFNGVA